MNFVYNGLLFMIPYTLAKMGQTKPEDTNISSLYLPVLFEMPSYVVSYFMIDWKMFGRKKTGVLGFFLAAFFMILTVLFKDNYFIILSSITRFFVNVVYMTVI